MMIKISIICFALTLIFQPPVDGQNYSQYTAPEDDKEFWDIGISTFLGVNLAVENRYLTHSLPLLIKERLEAIPIHHFGEMERKEHRKAIIRAEERSLGQELIKIRSEKDELIFKKLQKQEREDKLEAYDQQITEIIEHLNALKQLEPEDITFPDEKPVSFKAGEESGLLLKSPLYSPLRMAKREGVDLLIWGRFEEVQEYLYLEVKALDSVLEREIFSYNDAFLREELYSRFDSVIQGLALIIFGRDWASLIVKPEPEKSMLYLDNEFIGSGETIVEYLLPGIKELRIVALGFEEKIITLKLKAGEISEQLVALQPMEDEKILFITDPPGAGVYRDSVWLGNTPLEIDKTHSPRRLLFQKEGYSNYPFYFYQETSGEINISLTKDLLDKEEFQKKRRNSFYAAFGIWALTVPVSIFLRSNFTDYALARNQAILDNNMDEAARLESIAYDFQYAYWGSLAVSTSLFINMMIKLIRYVASADRKAG